MINSTKMLNVVMEVVEFFRFDDLFLNYLVVKHLLVAVVSLMDRGHPFSAWLVDSDFRISELPLIDLCYGINLVCCEMFFFLIDSFFFIARVSKLFVDLDGRIVDANLVWQRLGILLHLIPLCNIITVDRLGSRSIFLSTLSLILKRKRWPYSSNSEM